ncbi:LicD family protein [Shouchella clausii]|uniref:LicD family protein n=1 Tax=Shouchella clausii TaxID=79880 RepID=UPI001BB39F55|nr:LicD family protein [Shouchella clausii]
MKYPGNLKEVQNQQILILKEFCRICEENDLTYHLFAGTLLGAVRHKGFIPWDDDIDVAMLREDYNKFITLCKTSLKKDFFLQNFETDPDYPMQFSKLRKNNTLFVEGDYRDISMHHGLYIDIFPLDNVFPNTKLGEIQRISVHFLRTLDRARTKRLCQKSNNKLVVYLRLTLYALLKLIPKKLTDRLQYTLLTLFQNKKTQYVSHLTNGATKQRFYKFLIRRDDFYDTTKMKFENGIYTIPSDYKDVLSRLYGDYEILPPKEKRVPHHGIVKIKL